MDLVVSKDSSLQYEPNLYKIHTKHLTKDVVKAKNSKKSFKKGYDKELDCVIISGDGTVGEIYEIQGLRVGLPKTPSVVYSRSKKIKEQKWEVFEVPAIVTKTKSSLQFNEYPDEYRFKFKSYIQEEFNRRVNGFWFMNKGIATYITGAQYMYIQWTTIDIGIPNYRDANRIFYYFWEACKSDNRCTGMCYLKNRRSGFSFMASSELVNGATFTRNSHLGMLSKDGAAAKEMFTDKVVRIANNYPFFFKPLQSGMDRPKTEISYSKPSTKLTKNNILDFEEDDLGEGLNTKITWKNTGANSYDGQKLSLFVGDEFGKILKPNTVNKIWDIHQTCLILGQKIVGKAMIGSTSNALDKGGEEFKKMYYESDLRVAKRNRLNRTSTGLYSLFIPAEWNLEGTIDEYGYPLFEETKEGEDPSYDEQGKEIEFGSIDIWKANVDGLKANPDRLNEYYRQFPMTEKHAFRDEAENSLFNLIKIYEQIDWNEDMLRDGVVMKGKFAWKDGIRDSEVVWYPDKNGRFLITWVPPKGLQNNFTIKKGLKYPANGLIGAFGCDSYDISGTVDTRKSNGALHGVTGFSMDAPSNFFFLEYIARPQTADIFFEEVLMACVFYGMPLLCENNKPRLLYHFRRRGYRGYSMERPDKVWNNLSVTEKEIGGIPNSSEDIKQAHAAAIESYIENHIGVLDNGNFGKMYLNRTLEDWLKFDINKRTAHDASISSGLALMAVNRLNYKPVLKKERQDIKLDFGKYKYQDGYATPIRSKNN